MCDLLGPQITSAVQQQQQRGTRVAAAGWCLHCHAQIRDHWTHAAASISASYFSGSNVFLNSILL